LAEENIFRAVFAGVYLVAFGVSGFHRWRAGRTGEKLDRSAEGLPVLILLRGGGLFSMLGALAYIFHPSWLAWASLPLPSAARWTGTVLAAVGLAFATWTLRHLGRNITDTVVARKNAVLVTSGPYRLVKHVRGDRLVMEAVENQWRLTPAFAKLTILKVPEDSTRVAMVRAGAVDIITIGIDNFKELKAAKVKVFEVPDFATVGVTLGGQWRTKATFDPKVPWVGDPKDPASMERAKKVRLAFNLAVDKPAVINAALGGLADPVAVSGFFQGRRSTPAELKPRGYDLAQAKKLMAEAGYPNCFAFTVNLVAWPGREYLPGVGEAVATQLEANLGCQIKRRPLDRAIFEKHFRDRTYAGEMLAWAAPALGTEAWEVWNLVGYSPAVVHLLVEDPQIDIFLEKLSATPDPEERVKTMQDMARFVYDLVPRIEIGAAKAIFGAGERVKTWPLVPANAFLPNLDYINLVWAPPGQPVVLAK